MDNSSITANILPSSLLLHASYSIKITVWKRALKSHRHVSFVFSSWYNQLPINHNLQRQKADTLNYWGGFLCNDKALHSRLVRTAAHKLYIWRVKILYQVTMEVNKNPSLIAVCALAPLSNQNSNSYDYPWIFFVAIITILSFPHWSAPLPHNPDV